MGGTFAPSMGNSMRQDRYGWVEMTFVIYQQNSGVAPDGGAIVSTVNSKIMLKHTLVVQHRIPMSRYLLVDGLEQTRVVETQ